MVPIDQRQIVDYQRLGSRTLYWILRHREWLPVAETRDSRYEDRVIVETVLEWGARQNHLVPRSELITSIEVFVRHKINPIEEWRKHIKRLSG
jgi:hypothetical protein